MPSKRNFETLDVSPTADKQKKSRKVDSVAPIIFFKVDRKFIKDRHILEKEILQQTKKDNINISEIKITANGNLLIFAATTSDKMKLKNNNDLLPHLKRLDLGTDEKKHFLIVKGATADRLKEFESDLTAMGIKHVQEILNKDGNQIKISKIELVSREAKETLSSIGFIQICLSRYRVENVVKPPIRCHKCKQFGHLMANCKNTETCAKCGNEHNTDTCPNTQIKCLNCGEKHSCYYKGCRVFKDLYKQQIEHNKQSGTNHTTAINISKSSNEIPNTQHKPSGTYRSYSEAISSNQPNISKLEEKLAQIENNLDSKLDKCFKDIKETLSNLADTVTNLSKSVKENNSKLCYFILDIIKLIVPKIPPPNETVMNIINQRMFFHNLGAIDSKTLLKYSDILWKSNNDEFFETKSPINHSIKM